MGTLILIKCTNFDPYLMAMHVLTEGDKLVFSSPKFETFAYLVGSNLHIIIIFHLKTNMQKLQTTSRKWVSNTYICCKNKINLIIYSHSLQNENIHTVWL